MQQKARVMMTRAFCVAAIRYRSTLDARARKVGRCPRDEWAVGDEPAEWPIGGARYPDAWRDGNVGRRNVVTASNNERGFVERQAIVASINA